MGSRTWFGAALLIGAVLLCACKHDFTVEDRDRSQGTYFVRYVEPSGDKKDKGFFAKLFSRSDDGVAPLKYRINIKSQGESTTVSVLNSAGTPEASANAQRIVQVIADDLK